MERYATLDARVQKSDIESIRVRGDEAFEVSPIGKPVPGRQALSHGPTRPRVGSLMVRTIPRREWTQALDGFTQRNAGRRTSLEVDAPGIGTQSQERDFQLRGVVYDPRDGRVEIMLGGFEGVGPHLTHIVADVEALDLLTDSAGRDTALRIAQQSGQTFLRIEL